MRELQIVHNFYIDNNLEKYYGYYKRVTYTTKYNNNMLFNRKSNEVVNYHVGGRIWQPCPQLVAKRSKPAWSVALSGVSSHLEYSTIRTIRTSMGNPRDRPLAGSRPRVDQGVEYNHTSYICPEDLDVTSTNNCYNPSSDDIASFLEGPQFDGPDSSRYYCDDDLRAIISPSLDPSSHSRTPLSPHINHSDVSSDSPSLSEITQRHNYHLQGDFFPSIPSLPRLSLSLDPNRHPCSPSQDVPSELSPGHSSPAQRQTTLTNHERHEIDWEYNHGPSSHGPPYPTIQRNMGTHPSIDFGQFVHFSPEPPVPDDNLKATRKRTSERRSRRKHLQLVCDSCPKEFSRRCDLK